MKITSHKPVVVQPPRTITIELTEQEARDLNTKIIGPANCAIKIGDEMSLDLYAAIRRELGNR